MSFPIPGIGFYGGGGGTDVVELLTVSVVLDEAVAVAAPVEAVAVAAPVEVVAVEVP